MRVRIRVFQREWNIYSILIIISIFFTLFSGCSSPRLGLNLSGGQTQVYESAKSYEDEDYDQWKNDYEDDRENWSPTGKETNFSLYPVLTYLPEGNFGLSLEISPIWIGANNFSEDGKGVNTDNATQFIAQGISGFIGIALSFDIPFKKYMFFGEQFGYITWTFDIAWGGGEANVILNKCEKGAICSKDNENNKVENILNERIRDIEGRVIKASGQINKEAAQRQSDSYGWLAFDPFFDYQIFEASIKTLRMKASNKKEYVIVDNVLAFKFVWGKLF